MRPAPTTALRTWRRGGAATAVAAAVLAVGACGGPPLPNSVVEGTTATVGWSHSMASTNTASVAGATPGDLDVAALTRSQFAEEVEGTAVVDESFGVVTIADENEDEFTVRYDLAEPSWSDGIGVDAADLLLAWAAGSNALAPADLIPGTERDETGTLVLPSGTPWFDSVPTGLLHSDAVPAYDEFARWIEVTYEQPVVDWQTALDIAVPAHVVGQLAFDLTDAMEAKQAVVVAITERDAEALAAIAEVWSTGFGVGDGAVPDELLLSSGPYVVEEIDQSAPDAQTVHLVANREYAGEPTGEYERVHLMQTTVENPLDLVGTTVDVVQVEPTAENWAQVRDLQRTDFNVRTAHDGTYWVLVLRTDRGDFRWPSAREALFGAIDRSTVAKAGAGSWATEQEETSVLMFPPGTSGYDIALEDAGFNDRYGLSDSDAILAREEAGLAADTPVCVLHDNDDEFAVAAFESLTADVAEAGWAIEDCGAPDVDAAASDTSWDAVLTTLPVPRTPAEIESLWGTDGVESWSAVINEDRDALIEELAQTSDQYEARDLKVAIEATLVSDAVALPLAMSMVVTVADRDIDGVSPRPGPVAPLTSGATDWGPAEP